MVGYVIRGEPEQAPNTQDTGSGFICLYLGGLFP